MADDYKNHPDYIKAMLKKHQVDPVEQIKNVLRGSENPGLVGGETEPHPDGILGSLLHDVSNVFLQH